MMEGVVKMNQSRFYFMPVHSEVILDKLVKMMLMLLIKMKMVLIWMITTTLVLVVLVVVVVGRCVLRLYLHVCLIILQIRSTLRWRKS